MREGVGSQKGERIVFTFTSRQFQILVSHRIACVHSNPVGEIGIPASKEERLQYRREYLNRESEICGKIGSIVALDGELSILEGEDRLPDLGIAVADVKLGSFLSCRGLDLYRPVAERSIGRSSEGKRLFKSGQGNLGEQACMHRVNAWVSGGVCGGGGGQ